MKIIAIISQKGGAGKTTLTLHLAVAYTKAGYNTAIIDLDPQASATKWSDRRTEEIPVVLSAHASRLHHEINRIKESGGEIPFLDTAPHSDSAALEAAKVADMILIPCRPAILDMEAIINTLDLVRTTKTPIYVVMNAVAPQGKERAEALEAIKGLGVAVAPQWMVERVAYARSLVSGQTAQEFEPDGKASEEIEHLYMFTCEQLNIHNYKKELCHDK
jgi:chromosome partitioning protein